MNVSLLKEEALCKQIVDLWPKWQNKKRQYYDVADWWELLVKPKIKSCVKKISYEKNQETQQKLNFYFMCLRDLQNNYLPSNKSRTKLVTSKPKHYKSTDNEWKA